MEELQGGKNIYFDSTQLRRLIINLHTLTGIWASILDSNGGDIQVRDTDSDFCKVIRSTKEGRNRCRECDARAVYRCNASQIEGIYSYRCHAGLQEYLLPIFEGGVPIAYLIFGQLLDSSPREEQWQKTEALLDWYNGGREDLRRHFFELRQCSDEEIRALAEVLQMLVSYIQMGNIIRTAEYTDMQKLTLYLDQHYTETLSLRRIADDLHIGTTKLCSMAKKLSNGKTISQLISLRRVNAAKKLLISRSDSISDIADMVGFADYNYFTRIFKAYTGMTPRAFRKSFVENRSDSE